MKMSQIKGGKGDGTCNSGPEMTPVLQGEKLQGSNIGLIDKIGKWTEV